MTLAEQKIGYRKEYRQADKHHLGTLETLFIRLHQTGGGIKRTEIAIDYIETAGGRPASLSKRLTSPSTHREILAIVQGDLLHIQINGSYEKPVEFLLPEGVRQRPSGLPGDQRELSFQEWTQLAIASR